MSNRKFWTYKLQFPTILKLFIDKLYASSTGSSFRPYTVVTHSYENFQQRVFRTTDGLVTITFKLFNYNQIRKVRVIELTKTFWISKYNSCFSYSFYLIFYHYSNYFIVNYAFRWLHGFLYTCYNGVHYRVSSLNSYQLICEWLVYISFCIIYNSACLE